MSDVQRMRVLIVDGSPIACEAVRAALASHYDLLFAATMGEALDLARAALPDLLVSEVDLSDGDGFALCMRIRELPGGDLLPILLLTNRGSIQDKVASFEAGADDYVVKPLDTRLFHARLRLLSRIKGLQGPRSLGA